MGQGAIASNLGLTPMWHETPFPQIISTSLPIIYRPWTDFTVTRPAHSFCLAKRGRLSRHWSAFERALSILFSFIHSFIHSFDELIALAYRPRCKKERTAVVVNWQNTPKCVFARRSAPYPAGSSRRYPDPLDGCGGDTPPHTSSHSAHRFRGRGQCPKNFPVDSEPEFNNSCLQW